MNSSPSPQDYITFFLCLLTLYFFSLFMLLQCGMSLSRDEFYIYIHIYVYIYITSRALKFSGM